MSLRTVKNWNEIEPGVASRGSRVDFLSFATRDGNVFQSAEPFERKTSSNIVSRVCASSSLATHKESIKAAATH